jgi:hypothetical protein
MCSNEPVHENPLRLPPGAVSLTGLGHPLAELQERLFAEATVG